jgi:acetyl-CoA carboxylase carboxyltransferase component
MTGDISRVRCRLETAVSLLPDEPTSPAELFDRYEMVATQILDSEFQDYTQGMLQELLMSFLYVRQIELGLITGPDPREQ